MANKYTALPIPPKKDLDRFYLGDFMTQKEIGKDYRPTKKEVLRCFKKLKIKSKIPLKQNQKGKNNAG